MKKFKEIILSLEWYDSRIHEGVMRYARNHRWLVHSNANNIPTPTNISPDGMIVSITHDTRFSEWVREQKTPCICITDNFDLDLPTLEPDYFAIGEMAANLFAERKFKNFACFFPHPQKTEPWIQERIEGFAETVKNNNGNIHLAFRDTKDFGKSVNQENKLKIQWFQKELAELKLPCGIFITSDDIAPLLQIACLESRLLIPEDIAIIGVNNNPIICSYTPVPLSSVDPGWEQLGYRAASMLDNIMNGEKIPNEIFKVPPAGVIERQSSSIVAVEDRNVSMAVTFIAKHLSDNPTVDEVCNAVNTPRRQLERAFRKHLNRSIKQELNSARIREVRKLLLQTDLTAVEISRRVNFSNEFQMYKIFKKLTGMTTKQFKQKSKKN